MSSGSVYWRPPPARSVTGQHFNAGSGTPVVVVGKQSAAGPLQSAFAGTPGIANVTAPQVRAGSAYLEGTLTSPPDSQAAYSTIDRVRSAVHAVPGAEGQVGGITAINLDVSRASAHDRDLIIPLILAVVLIILGLLMRAIVAPLILTATVVLSFAAPSASAPSSSTTCSGSAAQIPRSRCSSSCSSSR